MSTFKTHDGTWSYIKVDDGMWADHLLCHSHVIKSLFSTFNSIVSNFLWSTWYEIGLVHAKWIFPTVLADTFLWIAAEDSSLICLRISLTMMQHLWIQYLHLKHKMGFDPISKWRMPNENSSLFLLPLFLELVQKTLVLVMLTRRSFASSVFPVGNFFSQAIKRYPI